MRTITEIQTFRDTGPFFWLIMAAIIIPFLVILGALTRTGGLDEDSWIGLTIIVVVLAATIVMLLMMKTYLKLETGQLTYRSNPFVLNRKTILVEELTEWYVTDHKWRHGLGYKVSMGGTRVFVMRPGKVLAVKTHDGRSYRFGINRPELVKQFIADHWETKDASYG